MKAVALAVLVAVAAIAQTPPMPRAGETIEVSIVNVDVVVTDRRGNHIRGLTANDFEIRDNGVAQPITNFAEYEEPLEPASGRSADAEGRRDGSAAPGATPAEKRTLVLFVERQTLTPAQADAFVASMKKLLHETVRPGDSAAVVSFRYVTKVEQDFTGDLAKLDAAIDRLRPMFDRFGDDTEEEAIRNAYWQEILDEDAAAAGRASAPSMLLNGTENAVRQLVDIRRKVQVLNVLVNAMAGVDGRKAILLASRRFGAYAGWEFIGNGLGPASSDAERFNTLDLREQLARNANAAGVTFYAIYPEGLVDIPVANVEQGPMRPGSFYRIDPARDALKSGKANGILMNETKAIGDLAAQTGGIAGWGFTDIAKIANAMREDMASYYSLAFRAPQKASTHKISVTTKNRAYVVRARREFVEKSDEAQMSDRVTAALYQPQRAPALQFDVEIDGIRKEKRRNRIAIVIHIPASALTTLPDTNGRSGSFRVYAVAGGLLGVNSDVFTKSQPFTIPANAKDAGTKIFSYSFEMITDTLTDRIAIGVYDELSKQNGVVRVKLTAPAPTNP